VKTALPDNNNNDNDNDDDNGNGDGNERHLETTRNSTVGRKKGYLVNL